MGAFALGQVGGCVDGQPCGCGEACPNTWKICVKDACTGDPLDGVSIVVTDEDDEEVDSCVTEAADGSSGDTGALYASSCVNGSGSPVWTSPGNATANDGVYATITSPGIGTGCAPLVWSSFSPSVPAGATIDGFKLEVWVDSSNPANSTDARVFLTKSGVAAGSDAAIGNLLGGGIMTYGGPTSKFGTTWTAAEANGVGVEWACKGVFGTLVKVDYARLTIYYTSTMGPTCCTFDLPSEGTYTATISKDGYLTRIITVDVGCDNSYGATVLMATHGARIRVYGCYQIAGTELEGVLVEILVGGVVVDSGLTDSDGIFEGSMAFSGGYMVRLSRDRFITRTVYTELSYCGTAISYIEADPAYVCVEFCAIPITKTLVLSADGGGATLTYREHPDYPGSYGWAGAGVVNYSGFTIGALTCPALTLDVMYWFDLGTVTIYYNDEDDGFGNGTGCPGNAALYPNYWDGAYGNEFVMPKTLAWVGTCDPFSSTFTVPVGTHFWPDLSLITITE